MHQGLLGWDAGWYESIARHGYAGAGHSSLRFFPLVPLAHAGPVVRARRSASAPPWWWWRTSRPSSAWRCSPCWPAARPATRPWPAGRRGCMCLAPPAFTQVMGYAEGTLAGPERRDHAGPAGPGVVVGGRAGARRRGHAAPGRAPRGARRRRGAAGGCGQLPAAGRVARVAAVAGPAVGFGAFLGWVGWRYGDVLAPLRVQQQGARGGRSPIRCAPWPTTRRSSSTASTSARPCTCRGPSSPWPCWSWPCAGGRRRYGAFAAAVLVVALTASNLDGFERYALSAFPLVLAGASVTSAPRVERAVLTPGRRRPGPLRPARLHQPLRPLTRACPLTAPARSACRRAPTVSRQMPRGRSGGPRSREQGPSSR